MEIDATWIVHEDEQLVVVDKPAGVVTDRTVDPSRDHLVAIGRRWFAARGREIELWAVHRLDAHTSGLVVLAKSKTRATELMQAFERREIEKIYAAVVAGTPPADRWEAKSFLAHERGRTRAVRSGGRAAHTEFFVRDRAADLARIEARPKTGRTHQIRVHLADAGLPILGDPIYAPPAIADRTPRMMLHARALAWSSSGRDYVFEAPEPPEFDALFAPP
jgi:23S rRNA pseudouridine1911/1915/1917 synthase